MLDWPAHVLDTLQLMKWLDVNASLPQAVADKADLKHHSRKLVLQ